VKFKRAWEGAPPTLFLLFLIIAFRESRRKGDSLAQQGTAGTETVPHTLPIVQPGWMVRSICAEKPPNRAVVVPGQRPAIGSVLVSAGGMGTVEADAPGRGLPWGYS
jgi:hypothetical protein